MTIQNGSDDWEEIPPWADALIPGIRDIGYNLESAVADIADNSITAEARNIGLEFYWAGEDSWITIMDDGNGMTDEVLKNAMRLGSKSPNDERHEKDLGRFGLGLKTASFSVCKSVTVMSKVKGGQIHTARWDIDDIIKTRKWILHRTQTHTGHEISKWLDEVPSGTIVLWEKLDRVVGESAVNDTEIQNHFNGESVKVKAHLEMVFHRFIENPRELVMTLNERVRKLDGFNSGIVLEAWDPFLTNHEYTQAMTVSSFDMDSSRVEIKPYVLPHYSHFREDEEGHKRAGGVHGWNQQQGFYVYRNDRVLLAGDWLGLFGKDEHVKLARISVDLPNDLDFRWSLDVRKSRVILPPELRTTFRNIGRNVRNVAENIYRARGSRTVTKNDDQIVNIWQQKQKAKKFYWIVDPEHPLVKAMRSGISGNQRKIFDSLIKVIGASIPVADAWIAQAENPEQIGSPMEDNTPNQQQTLAKSLLTIYMDQGMSKEAAINSICADTFPQFPAIRGLLEEF